MTILIIPFLCIIVITSGCCYALLNLLAWHTGTPDIDVTHIRRMK
jgi:hypothetical protein